MNTATILIQKTAMSGPLGLFAPAVARGAEIYFDGSDGDLEVDFPNVLPFEPQPTNPFRIPSTQKISQSAALGIYVFSILSQGNAIAYLQLAVESDGISKVGFCVKPSYEVHTELYLAEGPCVLSFEKNVINEIANISLAVDGLYSLQTTIDAGEKAGQVQVELSAENGVMSIQLERPKPAMESGGTEVIDIIVEPPPFV